MGHAALSKALFIPLVCVILSQTVQADVLYSGGNPGTIPSPQPPGSGMAWNFYSTSSYWSKPYVGVVVAPGDQWTVTGFEFYEAVGSTTDPLSSVKWDIRTTTADLNLAGEVASGAATNVLVVDSGLNMTSVYNYDIYKYTLTLDTPVVLAGGQTYYFSTMLNRGRFADLNEATVFSNGTGQVGTSPDTSTDVWYAQLGYPNPFTVRYSSSDLAFKVIGTSVAAVPEPSQVGMLAMGGVLLMLVLRRRHKVNSTARS